MHKAVAGLMYWPNLLQVALQSTPQGSSEHHLLPVVCCKVDHQHQQLLTACLVNFVGRVCGEGEVGVLQGCCWQQVVQQRDIVIVMPDDKAGFALDAGAAAHC